MLNSKERWDNASKYKNNVRVTKYQNKSQGLKKKGNKLPSLNATIHKCDACGSTDIDLAQVQTRGADEPMTCYYTCHSCKKKWTEN